ncbi:MAG: hypothetical protein IKJ06_02880 [Clostridia bacterium]|nr:hypothetical protein [Clostridia bacterium]
MKKLLSGALAFCLIFGVSASAKTVTATKFCFSKACIEQFVKKCFPNWQEQKPGTTPQQKPEQKPETENTQKPEQKPETDNSQNQQTGSYAQAVLELVNAERAKNGLNALKLDSALSKVAEAHSKDMATRNFFSHTNPDGLSPFDRIKNAGISYKTAGENIAMGQKTPQQVVEAWMNSEGHRKNILNASFTKMGLGKEGNYWTQLFIG